MPCPFPGAGPGGLTAIPAEREVKIAMKTWVQMNETQRALVEENLSLVGQTIARHIRYNEDICGMGADDLYCLVQTEVLPRPRWMVNSSSSEITLR